MRSAEARVRVPDERSARPPVRRPVRLVAPALAAALLAIVCSVAGARPSIAEQETLTAEEPPEEPLAYTVRIEGVTDGSILSVLEQSSQLLALRERAPTTRAALVRRIEGDFERFRAVLRSESYYDSVIEYRIDDEQRPTRITIQIDPGPPYLLKSYDVEFAGDEAATAGEPPPISSLGLRIGERARATGVIAAETRVLGGLADRGYPLARLIDRDAVVDHRDRSMTVAVHIDPGPIARFGRLTLEGLSTVDERYVRSLVPWQEGETYDQRKVNAYRDKLVKTGLFSTVVVNRAESPTEDGELPMTITMIEGKQRSIGAGAKYYTSEGPAGEVFWEHRNLFGRNEDLRITLEVGMIRQDGVIDFTLPDWRRPDQDFLAELKATRQTTNAFNELGASTFAKVRRPLSDTWTGSAGTSLEWSQLRDSNGTQSSTLLGGPASIWRDATDDVLNPRKGTRVRLDATPYGGWYDQTTLFLVTSLSGSGYIPLDGDKRWVLAGRAKIGSIPGPSRDQIPANKRFYAGGGDSVRGYQYQRLGPLDQGHDPLGGRSLFEVGAEFRAMVWGNFSLVPFVDGGNVYTPIVPDFSEDLLWAAGIGARYNTVVGPVRFDIAFPLNPRHGVDDPFQFYISLGQAF